jgi:hypothetical protein
MADCCCGSDGPDLDAHGEVVLDGRGDGGDELWHVSC